MTEKNLFLVSVRNNVMKKCSVKWNLEHSVMQCCDLTFVLGGEAIYFINGEKKHLKKGDAIFINAGETRKAYTFKENPMVCTAFAFDVIEGDLSALPKFFNWENNYKLKMYFKEFYSEWIQQEENYKTKSNAMLALIICEVLSLANSKNSNPHVEKMKKYIAGHFAEKITVEEIAQKCKLHPAYCGVLFKEYTGMSILKFTNTLRVNLAKNMLMENDLSVGEIADLVGFFDLYYFSKTFKNLVGISPLAYQKTMKV